VFVDEGFWAGDKAAEGVIKSLITEPYQMIEAKGKDAICAENHVNLIIASNNSWVVPAGLEERRFLVLDVSDCHQQDHKYFADLYKQMESGGLEAMFFELLKHDFSKVNLREIPRTKGLLEQILSSMSTPRKFWFETLKDGVLIRGAEPPWPDWVEGELLSQEYLFFCERHHDRYPLAKHQFFIELRKICSGVEKDRRRRGSGKRFSGWKMPCLEECRQEFSGLLKMPVDWDDLKPENGGNLDRIPF
jgi:hypothetical protein